jgi:hypothetical protein
MNRYPEGGGLIFFTVARLAVIRRRGSAERGFKPEFRIYRAAFGPLEPPQRWFGRILQERNRFKDIA